MTRIRWALRRWTLKHVWYRIRLPARRRRWMRENERITAPYAKREDLAPTNGPALVFGDFSGKHGLSRAAVYDVEPLKRLHSTLEIVDIGPFLKGKTPDLLQLTSVIFENVYFLCQPDTYATICRLIRPDQIAGAYRTGRWVWETPLFPDNWRFAEQLVHRVWTPSRFCAETFRQALNIKIDVVPYSVRLPSDNISTFRDKMGINPRVFLGLAVMDITSCPERKNPWAHIEAWKKAFGHNKDAILIMKIRFGKRTQIIKKELNELIGLNSNIRIITNDMSNHEMAEMHLSCDVFLSLHRSEGYGLNIIEALNYEKIVIASNWSANSEYGPDFENYIGVNCDLIAYSDWTRHYSGRFLWAQARIPEVVRILREVAAACQTQPRSPWLSGG